MLRCLVVLALVTDLRQPPIGEMTPPPQKRGLRPQRLLVTVLGSFFRHDDGWAPEPVVRALMSHCDVNTRAMRASAQRLNAKGFIDFRDRNAVSGFQLTARAQSIVANADQRIFNPRTTAADHGWVLAIFSVPESQRSDRHLLRSRLEWLGFGRVANGVWIAPDHNETELRSTLEELLLERYVTILKSQSSDLPSLLSSVQSWWDLDRIESTYRDFLLEISPTTAKVNSEGQLSDAWAFTNYVNTLTLWRRLPFFDPGLSARYLPSSWAGYQAFNAFMQCHDLLEPRARRYVSAKYDDELPALSRSTSHRQ